MLDAVDGPRRRDGPTSPSPRSSPSPRAPRRAASVHEGEVDQTTQVVVIGSGPGGYAAAFRAADLGLQTTLVERYARSAASA